MKKKVVYIRFFKEKNGKPFDFTELCNYTNPVTMDISRKLEVNSFVIATWMNRHPDGKIDLIWLDEEKCY